MAEDGVGNLQDALDLLDLALLEVELGDDVMPFPVVLDGVCEPTLTPRGDLLELASVRLDQLADLIDLLLDRLIVKLRLHDVHQLVCRQTRPPFLWDLLRLWPRGGSGAGKRPEVFRRSRPKTQKAARRCRAPP